GKLLLHELCVKNTPELIQKANEVFNINLAKNLPGGCIKNRMLYVKRFFDRMDLQSIERLESLERLGRLPNKLKLSNKDYQDIKFKNDSVIYCDPPYKGTESYGVEFDHDVFYEWVRNQNNPIYISEYDAPDDFIVVHSWSHRSTLSATENNKKVIEKLFWNGKGEPRKHKLF